MKLGLCFVGGDALIITSKISYLWLERGLFEVRRSVNEHWDACPEQGLKHFSTVCTHIDSIYILLTKMKKFFLSEYGLHPKNIQNGKWCYIFETIFKVFPWRSSFDVHHFGTFSKVKLLILTTFQFSVPFA